MWWGPKVKYYFGRRIYSLPTGILIGPYILIGDDSSIASTFSGARSSSSPSQPVYQLSVLGGIYEGSEIVWKNISHHS